MEKTWYVYLCERRSQIYTGITTDLTHWLRQHKTQLLYSEAYEDKYEATRQEKATKAYKA